MRTQRLILLQVIIVLTVFVFLPEAVEAQDDLFGDGIRSIVPSVLEASPPANTELSSELDEGQLNSGGNSGGGSQSNNSLGNFQELLQLGLGLLNGFSSSTASGGSLGGLFGQNVGLLGPGKTPQKIREAAGQGQNGGSAGTQAAGGGLPPASVYRMAPQIRVD